MILGMLWYDASKETLSHKVNRAGDYYKKKYGNNPDVCLVNPKAFDVKEELHTGQILVRPDSYILPNHLWIGIEEKVA